MSEQTKNTCKCHTFAVLTGRIPPFFMVRRRRRWREMAMEIGNLDGLAGVTPAGPVLMVHMETENDAIIAKNRLRFLGIPVSEETRETEIQRSMMVRGEEE